MTQSDLTLSRQNLEMVTIAGEYCKLIENSGEAVFGQLLQTLRHFVPLLYLRGSLLQAPEPQYPEAAGRFVTEEEWDQIFLSLRKVCDNKDEFYFAGLSEFGDDSLITGSISEHLTDVYQDLKDFTLLFKRPSLAARENALYECAQLFNKHWGLRLATLLPVIHRLTEESDARDQPDPSDFF
ncbi:DUF5063 domain-containing protein [Bacteroidales bacterium]